LIFPNNFELVEQILLEYYDESEQFCVVVIESAMAELGRLLMYEASRDWLVSWNLE
jgi:hypothetical protein